MVHVYRHDFVKIIVHEWYSMSDTVKVILGERHVATGVSRFIIRSGTPRLGPKILLGKCFRWGPFAWGLVLLAPFFAWGLTFLGAEFCLGPNFFCFIFFRQICKTKCLSLNFFPNFFSKFYYSL